MITVFIEKIKFVKFRSALTDTFSIGACKVFTEGIFMGRPFYPNEVDDPDLDWLVSNFLSDRPDFLPVESGLLPLILIPYAEEKEAELPELAKKKISNKEPRAEKKP